LRLIGSTIGALLLGAGYRYAAKPWPISEPEGERSRHSLKLRVRQEYSSTSGIERVRQIFLTRRLEISV